MPGLHPSFVLAFFLGWFLLPHAPGMGPHPHSPLKLGRKSPEAAWLLGGRARGRGEKEKGHGTGLGRPPPTVRQNLAPRPFLFPFPFPFPFSLPWAGCGCPISLPITFLHLGKPRLSWRLVLVPLYVLSPPTRPRLFVGSPSAPTTQPSFLTWPCC